MVDLAPDIPLRVHRLYSRVTTEDQRAAVDAVAGLPGPSRPPSRCGSTFRRWNDHVEDFVDEFWVRHGIGGPAVDVAGDHDYQVPVGIGEDELPLRADGGVRRVAAAAEKYTRGSHNPDLAQGSCAGT